MAFKLVMYVFLSFREVRVGYSYRPVAELPTWDLPTLTALLEREAKVVVCAHLGRPAGQPDPKYSLAPAAARLAELLGRPVPLAADVTGPSARAAVAAVAPGGLVMLENLRFDQR